jgi:hypothetical protein
MEILLKCWKCGEFKPVEDFHKDNGPRGKDRHGTQRHCKVCASKLASMNRKKKLENDLEGMKQLAWEKNLRNRFKMTTEDWNKNNEEQNEVCAVCGNKNASGRRLDVDHDHGCCPGKNSCGKCIRDLLCNSCNTFIGKLEMDSERTKKALAYIGWGE